MSGALEKLKIEAYTDPKYSGQPDRTFEVMYNPKSYALKYAINYDEEQGKGVSPGEKRYVSTKPQDITLEFTIDGTGASGDDPVDVSKKVKGFLDTCYTFHGEIHRPPYLKVAWGELVFTCVLQTANVTYTLFKPGGQPLRAKISATFSEFVDEQKRTAKERRSSPDLTHIHTVSGRESLPLLCHRYYGDQRYYLRVAQANRLLNFRRLDPGSTLFFPPIAKLAGKQ